MAHDFTNAYGNVKLAVEGLTAVDSLRDSLNRASARFETIDDDDFETAPLLGGEFRALRTRLCRDIDHARGPMLRSLDAADSAGMVVLAESLIAFWRKVESNDLAERGPERSGGPAARVAIRDPGPE